MRIPRRSLLKSFVTAAAAPFLASGQRFASAPLDLMIRNGRVIDGSGLPAFQGDVGIKGDAIVTLGRLPGANATKVIDAGGLVVAPGFIDPHTHEEVLMLRDAALEKFVRQGVTTIINGNCGHSIAPFPSAKILEYWWREGLISKQTAQQLAEQSHWDSLAGYADAVRQCGGASINSALLLGYGGIRWIAMRGGYERPPNGEEWKRIETSLREGLSQGAVGMSTGLSYIPCRYADTDELVRAGKILAQFNATYASHTRFGRPGDPTGGKEAIEIGERAGCRVQISHFVGASSDALEMVTSARRRGLEVAADIIPSSLSHRRRSDRMLEALFVFYPGLFDKSIEELRAFLVSPEGRTSATKSVQFLNTPKDAMVIVRAETPKNRPLVGKSVAQIGKERQQDSDELLIALILDEQNPVVFTFDGDRRARREPTSEELERRFGKGRFLEPGEWTRHPLCMPGSDSIPVDSGDPYGWYEQQRRGAFPAFLHDARRAGVPLEQAVQKATSLAASQFRLGDRGLLAEGKAADVIVFDPEEYRFPTPAEADPNEPFALARGVRHVVVNGKLVLTDDKMTGVRPGRVLLNA